MRFAALLLALTCASALADDVIDAPPQRACLAAGEEKPLATEYGSAGFMKNLAESADSIRAIAARLLESALSMGNDAAGSCRSSCTSDEEVAEVIYRVTPVAFLPVDKQNDVCLAFEEKTRDEPMRFDSRGFKSVPDLNEWLMAFSQGRGDDGKLLYERCSSNCSPRYTFAIAAGDDGYEVEAEVLCGLARDKSNDQYLISTALRRRCAAD